MLCLAPIELVTEAERRLYRALAGLGPGTGVLGGLVVFVPVVDGAMQRRQADAVAFLPETVVVVRALGMGRQAGELRPSADGAWTVGGEALRLSGGGSSPAGQLRRAVDLLCATLDSGGLDPGAPAALAAIDGPISSVRDRSAGGPVACSLDAGDVLTGLRHCATAGSQGDTRVWTTADVRAALAIFGLQTGGPSIEELNNEGFLYSPYILRRSRSAVGAHADAAPAVSLLSGTFPATAAALPKTPPLPADPDWDEDVPERPAASSARKPSAAWRDEVETEWQPAVSAPAAAPAAVAAPPRDVDDSGVGGLYALPAETATGGVPAQSTAPAPPRRRRTSAVAVLATLLALVAIAGLIYVLVTNLGAGDEDNPGSAIGTTTTTGSQGSTAPTTDAPPTQQIAGSTYTQEAVRSDTECAANAYGQVAEFFVSTPCTGLTRALFTTSLGDEPAVVSVSVVSMPDEASAAQLQELADTSGTGNVSDLLRAGVQIDGGQSELVAAAYASQLSGSEVRIVEVAWLDEAADADESLLEAAADDALQLDVTQA